MKKWLRYSALLLVAALANMSILPGLAAATLVPPGQVELRQSAPAVNPPVMLDFTDADFEGADQPEFGPLRGSVIPMIGALLAFLVLLLLVVMVLFTI
ncbi:MAG TPA: hypothetical protein VL860_12260 [Planctomycetota bacterium]|nr:hypothetical protein [Planctomycetota bacterium]